jgi:hypothetical protein
MQAKLILRRIELRDLYTCSGKIRVPKMLSDTRADHGDQRPDPIPGTYAQNHHNGHLWRAMQAMRRQPQGETIHDLLDRDVKQRINVKDMWIEVCDIVMSLELLLYLIRLQFEMIKVPSEGNDNPIDKVIFYKKPKGKKVSPTVLKGEEVKAIVSYSL